MKKCRRCDKLKKETEFYSHPTTKDSLGLRCKDCVKDTIKQFENKNPDSKFGKNLKRKYWNHLKWRDALAEYRLLESAQGGVCAICFEPEFFRKTLSVDHCHKTGKVRALLCSCCNAAEGFMRTPENADRLAAYMRFHQ
jgi:hypothetical protein